MKLASGHEVVIPPENIQNEQKKDFKGYQDGVVKLVPGEWFFTKPFLKYADALYQFKFKPTDVLIITFPKCGTTWMQEIVWTMRNNPNLDNPMDKMPIMSKVTFLELDFICECATLTPPPPESKLMQNFFQQCPGKDPKDGVFLQLGIAAPDPRTLKTHLPFTLLSPETLDVCKVVYVARNPKDACISFHHHSRIMKSHTFVSSFDKFVQHYVDNNVLYAPYWPHLKEALDRRSHPNLHICYYEDLKADPKKGIQNLDKFLGTKLNDQQVDNVVEHTSFKSMKARDNLVGGREEQAMIMQLDLVDNEGGFFRKGESGDHKNKLTPEQEAKMNKWIKNAVKDYGEDVRYAST